MTAQPSMQVRCESVSAKKKIGGQNDLLFLKSYENFPGEDLHACRRFTSERRLCGKCELDESLGDSTKKDRRSKRPPIFFGGTDENRTRVQKPLDMTFSVGSHSFKIPPTARRVTGSLKGSTLMLDRYKCEISVQVHY